MDVSTFFTRLLQNPKEPSRSKAQDDIGDFDFAWKAIRETLEHPDERQLNKGITVTDVPAQLLLIVDALVYEGNRSDEDTTGACLEYFLKNDLLGQLERFSVSNRPQGIKREVVKTINNLIVLLSERFLVHNAVHRPLRHLLRSCVSDQSETRVDGARRLMGAAGRSNSDDRAAQELLEGELVDLMCNLCSRIRAYPPLLLIFFHDKGWQRSNQSSSVDPSLPSRTLSPTPTTVSAQSLSSHNRTKTDHHFEFLLFSYLLRFVHREGRIGDFARAGLLFLFDIAFLTAADEGGENLVTTNQDAREALGEFILDGDFADVIAAGLGAIYSLLPSKLKVPTAPKQDPGEDGLHASTSGGMHLGAVVDGEDELETDYVPLSTDEEVHDQLDLLLKLFDFLHGIIHRCNSPISYLDPDHGSLSSQQALGPAVSEAILEAIQSSFLDNVLYPSIMECSSTDGSAVAVMTYLDALFSNLDDGPVLHLLISYLLGLDADEPNSSSVKPARPRSREDYAGRDFTMKDLLIDNLRSTSSASRAAASRLLRTMLIEHGQYVDQGLLSAIAPHRRHSSDSRCDHDEIPVLPPARSTGVRPQEVELYGSLITQLDPSQIADPPVGYSGYLADMHMALQADRSYLLRRSPLHYSTDEDTSLSDGRTNTEKDRLDPHDPLLRAILHALGGFFLGTAEDAVALTGVFIALALSADRPSDASQQPEDNDVFSAPKSGDRVDPVTGKSTATLPAVYQILHNLTRQTARFRTEILDFDRLLSERRQGLLFADHLDEAMTIMLDVEPAYTPLNPVSASPQPKKRSGMVGKLTSFLTPKKRSATPSRAETPIREAAARVDSSPFKAHYDLVGKVGVEAMVSSPISSGPWSPGGVRLFSQKEGRAPSALSQNPVESTMSTTSGEVEMDEEVGSRRVALSAVLDNCVILEEFIKEIVSVITARRVLGID